MNQSKMRIKLPTTAEKYSRSLTYIKHFIENAQMQIDKMEIQNKTNPRIIEAKRKSLNLIEKFVYDTQNYIRTLENPKLKKNEKNEIQTFDFKNYMNDLNIDEPGQREAKRYLSIQAAREKWSELF